MSFEEKGTWLTAVIAILAPVLYLPTVVGQLTSMPFDDIDYQGSLLTVVGATIGLSILGMIAIAISSPDEADKSDQRDREIGRLGEYVGGIVLAVGMIVPFGLALAEIHQFWIAHAMYLAFAAGTLSGSIVKLVAYRRGF